MKDKEIKKTIATCCFVVIIGLAVTYWKNKMTTDDSILLIETTNSQATYPTQNKILSKVPEKKLILVQITGEIYAPGIYKVEENLRIMDVIKTAGGLNQNADIEKINLISKIKDGKKIHIPALSSPAKKPNTKNHAFQKETVVNINNATESTLTSLPKIGSKTASNIIQYRSINGNFKQKKDLLKVKGIGEKTFKLLEQKITL